MPTDAQTQRRHLRELCRLNGELNSIVQRRVSVVCGQKEAPSRGETAAGQEVSDLPDAILAQRAIFSFLVRCLDSLGGDVPDEQNPCGGPRG